MTLFLTIIGKAIGLVYDEGVNISLPNYKPKRAIPDNAKEVPMPDGDFDPAAWRLIDPTDPRYHTQQSLTPEEKKDLTKRGCDFVKAKIIKAKMEEGYDKSKNGYSNSKLAELLTNEMGEGYSLDNIKRYAPVFRKGRSKARNPYSTTWAG